MKALDKKILVNSLKNINLNFLTLYRIKQFNLNRNVSKFISILSGQIEKVLLRFKILRYHLSADQYCLDMKDYNKAV